MGQRQAVPNSKGNEPAQHEAVAESTANPEKLYGFN